MSIPCSASRSTVFGPIPGISPGPAEAKRSHACSRVSTTKPFGFSASDATFATSFVGPIPIEHARPVASSIAALTRRAAALGRSKPPRSRYASSSPTTSTRSTCSRRTAMTSRERAL